MNLCPFNKSKSVFIYLTLVFFKFIHFTQATVVEKTLSVKTPSYPELQWPKSFSQIFKYAIVIEDFVQQFRECEIHIVNYRGDDISPFRVPIVLSRWKYLIAPRWSHREGKDHVWPVAIQIEKSDEFMAKTKNKSLEDYFQRNKVPGKQMEFMDTRENPLANWRCFVHTHLFPPTPAESQEYWRFMDFGIIDSPFKYFRNPIGWLFKHEKVQERTEQRKDSITMDQSRKIISINIIRKYDYPSALHAWLLPHDIQNCFLYVFIMEENLSAESTNDNIITHSSKYFVCQYCSLCNRQLVPLGSIANYQELVEWSQEIVHNNYNVPVLILHSKLVQHIGTMESFNVSRILNNQMEISFVSFIREIGKTNRFPGSSNWMVDFELMRILFNASKLLPEQAKFDVCVENPGWNVNGDQFPRKVRLYEDFDFPKLTINSMTNLLLVRRRDAFTFLSCGNPKVSQMSLWGMVTGFKWEIWVAIFIFILIWPIYYSVLTNFLLKEQFVFDALFVLDGISILLEQSADSAFNKISNNQRLYFGVTMLVMVVLTNAYRGDNIKHLSLPVRYVPVESVEDLVTENFSIFAKQSVAGVSDEGFEEDLELAPLLGRFPAVKSEIESLREFYPQQMNETKYRWISGHVKMVNNKSFDWYNPYPIPVNYTEVFKDCNNVAIFGWKDTELEFARSEYLYDIPNHKVSIGKEKLFEGEDGWRLENYLDGWILKRIKNIAESGIQNVWENIEMGSRKTYENAREYETVRIRSNLVMQFLLFVGEIAVCVVVFLFELRSQIWPVCKMMLRILHEIYFDAFKIGVSAGFSPIYVQK